MDNQVNIYRSRVTMVRKDFKQLVFYIDYAIRSNVTAKASELVKTFIESCKSDDVINYSVRTEKLEVNEGGEEWKK